RLEDRLAVVERLEPRDLVGLLEQPVRQPADEASALAGRHLSPWTAQRRARGLDRLVDVALVGGRNGRDDFFVRGIDDLHGLPAGLRFSRLAAMPSLASSL